MKVLLNVSVLRVLRTGIGQYTWELAKCLSRQPNLEVHLFDGFGLREDLSQMSEANGGRFVTLIRDWLPVAYQARRYLMQKRFTRLSKNVQPDIYHEPSLWPLTSDVPNVMTLHDLTHIHYPETQPKNRLKEIERTCLNGIRRSKTILVDSKFIAQEVVSHYGVSQEKIVVAPLGVSNHFRPREKLEVEPYLIKLGLRYHKYILSIGTLEPRKNLSFTLRAHQRMTESMRREYPLVLVGMAGWRYDQFSTELRAGISEGTVRVMGYLNDETLAAVTSGAKMMVYPSIYEGFGLPVVEAMASGLPVITSNRASLPEVAGSAAEIIELDDTNAYRQAMVRLIEDNNHWFSLQKKGFVQASQFTWQRCAEKTVSAYRMALAASNQ